MSSRLLCCAVEFSQLMCNHDVCVQLQVPEECPQVVSDLVIACTSQKPSDRPTSQQIISIIEASLAHPEAGANGQVQEDA